MHLNLFKQNPTKKEELEKRLKAFIQLYNQNILRNTFRVKKFYS